MGFKKIFKSLPLPKLLRAVGSGEIGDIPGIFNFNDESRSELKAKKRAEEEIKLAQSQGSESTAEQARLKSLSDLSVQQQEEQARRRTIFGGDAMAQTQERKTLLGQ